MALPVLKLGARSCWAASALPRRSTHRKELLPSLYRRPGGPQD